jgi:hypothetical protein
MEIIGITIGAFATLVGIIAGIVQVVQYIQERKNGKQAKAPQIRTDTNHTGLESEVHNLPVKQNLPNARRFIGREGEIEKIMAVLRPYPHSQEHLITIDGVGGIGKSALAIEIAHRLLRQYPQTDPAERFDAIIWTSAKRDLLTADGVFPRTQIIRTLEQIYIVIAFVLGQPEIMQMKIDEQFNAIRKLLSQQRTLLIVDNLETIDDEEIISFLRELPAPTKCIVTSRHRIDVAYPIRLQGMSEEEAKLLINTECLRHGILLPAEDSKQLFKRTGGVPLAMVLSTAQIARGFGIKVVLDRLGKYTNDVTRFCFDYSLEKLNANEWKLLMTLSLFSEGTTREFLGEISELPELDRDQGLAELEKLSLINRSSNNFWMLPLSLEYVHAKMLEASPEITAKLKHNFAKAYLNIKIESTEAAKVRIQAVHLAIDLSDLIVWDTVIADYLSANRRAINRGVAITRIFVLERELTYLSDTDKNFHPEIRRILDEQLQTGIDVRILWWETTRQKQLSEPADLIIFDGNEVHIHKGHGGWYPDVQITTDLEEIKLWGKRFSQWMESSQPWHVMRRE